MNILEEQLEDPVLDGLELVLVSVDPDDELVTLFLQVRSLQSHHVTADHTSHVTEHSQDQVAEHSQDQVAEHSQDQLAEHS